MIDYKIKLQDEFSKYKSIIFGLVNTDQFPISFSFFLSLYHNV
jgi:hypothetical protein